MVENKPTKGEFSNLGEFTVLQLVSVVSFPTMVGLGEKCGSIFSVATYQVFEGSS